MLVFDPFTRETCCHLQIMPHAGLLFRAILAVAFISTVWSKIISIPGPVDSEGLHL